MNRIMFTILGTLVAAIIAYGVYDFYETHEKKEVTSHQGFRGEARKNPLYAARLFLKRMGIPAKNKENLQGLLSFPNTNTVLVVDTNRTTMSSQRTEALIDWIKSGGHLIAHTTRDWQYSGSEKEVEIKKSKKFSPDPLQRFLGVRTGERNYPKEANEEVNDIIDDLLEGNIIENKNKDDIRKIKLKGVDKSLALDDTRFRNILLDKDRESSTEKVTLGYNTYMVRQRVGDGLVTLVADLSFIENKSLEKADHAEIFWHLIHGLHQPINQPEQVWLIYNDEMPSLWEVLWTKFWALIVSLTLLFFAWLLQSISRFGPMIPKQAENRRSLNEHISSSGNFYWKYDKKQTLIQSSRKALIQRLTKIFPGWSQRSEKEQVLLLAEQLNMKPEAIQQIIFSDINNPSFEQAETFTQLISDLDKIRKQI